ncbi:MAG: hypothetical protein A3J83_07545 [Elusimicrobia bacterium RIFOXYA2_FULL_40_6]|nr:MAG: hypothetical protein A3J83_07545 [Elusimicrobia bacterium RIFOXYA2_FULL_40_6]
MKKIKLIFSSAFSVVLLTCITLTATAGIGGTALPFLKIDQGAAASGMGGTSAAIARGSMSGYWNPAGYGYVREKEISFTHMTYFESINYESVAYVKPLNLGFCKTIGLVDQSLDEKNIRSALGFYVGYLNYGDMEKTLETSGGDYDTANNLGLAYTAHDMVVGLGYGEYIKSLLMSYGVSLKMLTQAIDGETLNSFAVDAGAFFIVPGERRVTIGLNLQNVGMTLGTDPLPMNAKAGFVYKEKRWSFGADTNYVIDDEIARFNVGGEYFLSKAFSVRAGFKSGYDLGSFTAGFGYKGSTEDTKTKKIGYLIDYAFIPAGDLGATHQVSVGIKFQ